MSAMSDYLEGQIRAHIFRTATFTKPAVLAIALVTTLATDASTGATLVEPPGANGYARQGLNPLDANWSAPDTTGGLTANQAILTFGPVTNADWAQVVGFAICDSATIGAGNVLVYGAFTVAKTAQVGDTISIAVNGLSVTFA